MSTTLIPIDSFGLAPGKYADKDGLKDVAGSAFAWLPRVSLMNGMSKLCSSGKMQIGRFALEYNKEKYEDLGKQVKVLVLDVRPKAMDTSDKEDVINCYNPKDAEFQRIKKEAGIKDSGCMFGPEYLLWVPNPGVFATYFANSETARNAAGALDVMIGQATRFESQLIQKKGRSWWGPVFFDCTEPIQLPDLEEAKSQIVKFRNPPEKAKEEAAPVGTRDR